MKRILCALLVATLPFGSVLADAPKSKNAKVPLVYHHELPNVPVDKSLPKQQRIDNRPLAVIVLRAKTNRLLNLLPLVPKLRAVIENARPGQVYEISG
jgi:hypothetical protein